VRVGIASTRSDFLSGRRRLLSQGCARRRRFRAKSLFLLLLHFPRAGMCVQRENPGGAFRWNRLQTASFSLFSLSPLSPLDAERVKSGERKKWKVALTPLAPPCRTPEKPIFGLIHRAGGAYVGVSEGVPTNSGKRFAFEEKERRAHVASFPSKKENDLGHRGKVVKKSLFFGY